MASLFYRERGSGTPVILLHGFPLHQEMWHDFAEKLSAHFRVITVDLPGLGSSAMLPPSFTLAQVAQVVLDWVKRMGLQRSILIGHSLGGYVALAMAKAAPELFNGLVLFHSTAYADSEERKESRNKVLEFVDKNGALAFTSNFIAPLFANPGHLAIEKVKAIASTATADAVKGYTQAMRDRPDSTDVLMQFRKPVLFLAGEKDAGITVDSINKQAAISPLAQVHILHDVAHMGMLEDEKKSLEIIRFFVEKSTVTN
jgi:pimeloyl-ACP methyl ester carboxylesterase